MRRTTPAEFVLAHTRIRPAPFVPEIRMHLSDDSLELWEVTQVAVDRGDLPPPFWAFVWAGGQALARHLLDSEMAAGRHVIDLATRNEDAHFHRRFASDALRRMGRKTRLGFL